MPNFNKNSAKRQLTKSHWQSILNGPIAEGQSWSIHLNEEIVWNGFITKSIVITDLYNQRVLAIEPMDLNLSAAKQVVSLLERILHVKKAPNVLVYDHSAFISVQLDLWCKKTDVKQFYLFWTCSNSNTYLARLLKRKDIQSKAITTKRSV